MGVVERISETNVHWMNDVEVKLGLAGSFILNKCNKILTIFKWLKNINHR